MWIVDKLRGLDRLRVHLLNLAQPTNEEINSRGSVKPVASVFNQPLNQMKCFILFCVILTNFSAYAAPTSGKFSLSFTS